MLPLINTLSPAAAPAETILGYSGVIIKSETQHIFVFDEIVTITTGGSKENYFDKGKLIEKRILQTAPVTIINEIKTILPAELQ